MLYLLLPLWEVINYKEENLSEPNVFCQNEEEKLRASEVIFLSCSSIFWWCMTTVSD